MAWLINTGIVRSVLIVGYPGVQPSIWSARSTCSPDPRDPIDTLVLPGDIGGEPGGTHSVPGLTRRAVLSPRHFTRAFTDDAGTVIAARCGFGSADSLQRNFVRRLGVSPDRYRKTFV